jgi:hypothetical protein
MDRLARRRQNPHEVGAANRLDVILGSDTSEPIDLRQQPRTSIRKSA